MPITDMATGPNWRLHYRRRYGILGAILWMLVAKTKYHVNISSAASEVHVLTSNNKMYIQRIVESINKAGVGTIIKALVRYSGLVGI